MKILVTGANGQLGSEIRYLYKDYSKYQFFFTDLPAFDVTQYDHIEKFIQSKKIDAIINCAAYTNVDKAEEEKELAFMINTTGVKNLAMAARKFNCKLIHISTDYVFDGNTQYPYSEEQQTNPIGVYGDSKLLGERKLITSGTKFIIIRTSWLYSSFGKNFVKTMLNLAKKTPQLSVVADQKGTPTYAADLANLCLQIINRSYWNQIYHFSNEGETTWYDFAEEIMKVAHVNCKILPITTQEYPTPAKRPAYSVLDKSKIKKDFDLYIPDWKDSLNICIKQLKGCKQNN